MFISKISITKSRTSGISASAKTKFNKIIISMDADLNQEDDYFICYRKLSEAIDDALDTELKSPPASIINNQ